MNEITEITDFYEYIKLILKWAIAGWKQGEGDGGWEVRNDKGIRKAKVWGKLIDRVGKDKERERVEED